MRYMGDMINLLQKQELILKHYREGESQRDISRQTGISRKTIRKYINQYEEKRKELLGSREGADNSALIEAIIEAPKYTVGDRPGFSGGLPFSYVFRR